MLFQTVKKVVLGVEVCQFALHQKPPLCKGRWLAVRRDGGIARKKLRTRTDFRRNRNIVLQQSLSHAVRVTAPFTQGSLGCSRTRRFFDKLRARAKARAPYNLWICFFQMRTFRFRRRSSSQIPRAAPVPQRSSQKLGVSSTTTTITPKKAAYFAQTLTGKG